MYQGTTDKVKSAMPLIAVDPSIVELSQLCAFCSPPPKGLPDSTVPIRQHGVQGQVLAITAEFCWRRTQVHVVFFAARIFAHLARCAAAILFLPAADIFHRALRGLPTALCTDSVLTPPSSSICRCGQAEPRQQS